MLMSIARRAFISSPRRRLLLDLLAIGTVFVVVVGVALAYIWPWMPTPARSTYSLERYMQVRDGDAQLVGFYDPDGTLSSWQSSNTIAEPGARVFTPNTRIRQAAREVLAGFYDVSLARQSNEEVVARLASVQVTETRARELSANGRLSSSTATYAIDPRGHFLVGFYEEADGREEMYDPPMLSLPDSLWVVRTWESDGDLSSGETYHLRGEVLEMGTVPALQGELRDCFRIEKRYTHARDGTATQSWTSRNWMCPGVGEVEWQQFNADGDLAQIGRYLPDAPPTLPPAPAGFTAEPEIGDPAEWTFTRVGRVRPSAIRLARSTIPPLWIPSSPPLLLAAGYAGDLIAFDVSDGTGNALWRFHTGATINGTPAYDPALGRVYFGATDKRLYALDVRGLYLWSFETNDSVVARPLVFGDLVIFGSQDRTVYALDAEHGTVRWKVTTGGPLVSSPALSAGVVVIGSYDGTVYGLDPSSGRIRWRYAAGAAIEAPIVAGDDVAYIATRDADTPLAALDAATGQELWRARADDLVRMSPALGPEHLAVVDNSEALVIVERATGKVLRVSRRRHWVGPPVFAGEKLFVADEDGAVYQVDVDGNIQAEWQPDAARSGRDQEPHLDFGPTVGGGAIWVADSNTVIRRLGSEQSGPVPLPVAWEDSVRQGATYTYFPASSAPAEYDGRAIVFSTRYEIALFDPKDGTRTILGTFSEGEQSAHADPVIAGDRLLAVAGETIHAVQLPDGAPLWQFTGLGRSQHPPVVAGDIVLWISQAEDNVPGRTPGTLHALDLLSGAPRWEASLREFLLAGGSVVRDGIVYIASPPSAFDLATGALRWRTSAPGLGYGGPALSEAGDALFVGFMDGNDFGVLALDARDGRELWRTSLRGQALGIYERLWPSGDSLVVPLHGLGIIALDAASGEQRWARQPRIPRIGAITVAGGLVWLALRSGDVGALDVDTADVVARSSRTELELEYNVNVAVLGGAVQRPAIIGQRLIGPIGRKLYGFELPDRIGP